MSSIEIIFPQCLIPPKDLWATRSNLVSQVPGFPWKHLLCNQKNIDKVFNDNQLITVVNERITIQSNVENVETPIIKEIDNHQNDQIIESKIDSEQELLLLNDENGALLDDISSSDESIIDKLIVEESIVDKLIVEESIIDKLIVKESIVDKFIVEESIVEESVNEESNLVIDENVANQSITESRTILNDLSFIVIDSEKNNNDLTVTQFETKSNDEDLFNYTVAQLRNMCKTKCISTKGNKSELVSRIIEFNQQNQSGQSI